MSSRVTFQRLHGGMIEVTVMTDELDELRVERDWYGEPDGLGSVFVARHAMHVDSIRRAIAAPKKPKKKR